MSATSARSIWTTDQRVGGTLTKNDRYTVFKIGLGINQGWGEA